MDKKIADIKDSSPNEATIKNLEKILKDAKAGKVRTVVCICGWDNDIVTSSWSIDGRNTIRKILTEVLLLQHDMANYIGLSEKDSVLFRQLEE